MAEKYKCRRCGKISAGRKPVGGDGTFMFPRKHQLSGNVGLCPGVFEEADPVNNQSILPSLNKKPGEIDKEPSRA